MMKQLFGALVGMLLVLAGAWVAGFDFNERGILALFVYFCGTLAGVCGFWAVLTFEDWK